MRRVVGVEWIDAYVTEFDTAGGREWSEERTQIAPDRAIYK
jgi:hypothetical protein